MLKRKPRKRVKTPAEDKPSPPRTLADYKSHSRRLEAELAGCRACREKIDCISRGEAFQSPSRRYERPKGER
jgi:hypothetical protein